MSWKMPWEPNPLTAALAEGQKNWHTDLGENSCEIPSLRGVLVPAPPELIFLSKGKLFNASKCTEIGNCVGDFW